MVKRYLETRCLSSLSKVFPDQELIDPPVSSATALRNETFSFQVAFRNSFSNRTIRFIHIDVSTVLETMVTVRAVGLAPSELPCYPDHDEHVLRTTAGLYPDPLLPLEETGLNAPPGQWRSIWITVELSGTVRSGIVPITVSFVNEHGELLAVELFVLEIIPALLPEQTLIHTEWLHVDCLAEQYEVKVFSEEHWNIVEQYVWTAVKRGINMLLTPLFTPPLDTAINGERLTVQLVDVEKDGDHYSFTFDRLTRWVDMCNRTGIRYLEFSHLFTQWGAKHAPKIMAVENGVSKRIFGWETDSLGDDYKQFLWQLLPQLRGFVRQYKLEHRSYFHVSDEPSIEHMPWYRSASEIIHHELADYPIIDAISDIEWVKSGLVDHPIPASDHIEPFLKAGVSNLWTYYCCAQYKLVSNRFFHMPSARNRIIGVQLYKYQIKGLLHWGYNFWFTQYSLRKIDPYRTTDADNAFPSGDAFLVYPGPKGPIESIRLLVLNEGLQDMRALECLESLVGRNETLKILEEDLVDSITFDRYPRDAEWLRKRREMINLAIKKHSLET